jgi:hypothetical protein
MLANPTIQGEQIPTGLHHQIDRTSGIALAGKASDPCNRLIAVTPSPRPTQSFENHITIWLAPGTGRIVMHQ